MIRQRKGRAIFGGTITAGLVVCVAGAAFACTKFYGNLTAEGNGGGNSTTTVAGDANASSAFQWCGTTPNFSGTDNAARSAYWGTEVDGPAGANTPELTITIEPATTCLKDLTVDANYLPGGQYKVGISNGYWDETTDGFAIGEEDNCHSLENNHSGTNGYGTIIDSNLTVSSTGYAGPVVYDDSVLNPVVADATASDPSGWNTICVYFPQGGNTNGVTPDPNFFNPANALNFRSV